MLKVSKKICLWSDQKWFCILIHPTILAKRQLPGKIIDRSPPPLGTRSIVKPNCIFSFWHHGFVSRLSICPKCRGSSTFVPFQGVNSLVRIYHIAELSGPRRFWHRLPRFCCLWRGIFRNVLCRRWKGKVPRNRCHEFRNRGIFHHLRCESPHLRFENMSHQR